MELWAGKILFLAPQAGALTACDNRKPITTRYEYWEVLPPLSAYFNREFLFVFVYCFSCRYLRELGLRQLGLAVPKTRIDTLESVESIFGLSPRL